MAAREKRPEKSSITITYKDIERASADELSPCREKANSFPANKRSNRRCSNNVSVLITTIGLFLIAILATAVLATSLSSQKDGVPLLQTQRGDLTSELTTLPQEPTQADSSNSQNIEETDFLACGSTPEEAESLGCVFDIMTFGWLHPNCFNSTMSSEWEQKWGPWEWRFQKNNTETIPDEDLKYQKVVWGTQGYHVVHCLYSFKLVHSAGVNGYYVSDEAGPISHTDHCIKTIAEPKTLDPLEVNTRIRSLYTKCVKLSE